MAIEAQTSDGGAEMWRRLFRHVERTSCKTSKKAPTVLDKWHKRDRRTREKEIAEHAIEASKGAAGLLHRLAKQRIGLEPKGCSTRRGHQPA